MYRLSHELTFPHPRYANEDGLLAIGGDLSPDRLLLAYQYGIFPWYNEGEPILWWSPNPRWVLFPKDIYISKTMRQVLRRQQFTISFNTCFRQVIEACAATPRHGETGTWLIPTVREAYLRFHELGLAHSVEVWQEGELVGGLYGVALGKIFYGESMFSLVSNASKTALIHLAQLLEKQGFVLIDCQVHTEHLESMGAVPIARELFLNLLETHGRGRGA